MRELPEVQAQIALHLRARLDELARDTDHSERWIRGREDAVRAEAAKALDDAEAEAADALAEVREQASAANTRAPQSTQAAMLEQLQQANAWTSVRQLLDTALAAEDPIAALEQAVVSAADKPGGLAALKFFTADWLAASGRPQRQQQLIRDALARAIDQSEAPRLSPLQRSARSILADVARGQGRLEENSRRVRAEIADYGGIVPGSQGSRAAALAGWGDSGHVVFRDQRGEFPAEAVKAAFGPRARAWQASARRSYPMLATPVPEVFS